MISRSLKSTFFVLTKSNIAPFPSLTKLTPSLITQTKRFYTKKGIILRDDKSGYFVDPNEVARRIVKLISLHDCIKDPSKITLESTWHAWPWTWPVRPIFGRIIILFVNIISAQNCPISLQFLF